MTQFSALPGALGTSRAKDNRSRLNHLVKATCAVRNLHAAPKVDIATRRYFDFVQSYYRKSLDDPSKTTLAVFGCF